MKTHRYILIISFIIGILSFPFLLILDNGKVYEIMLAFLTSSIISFLLELPIYCSLKNENKSKLYASLFFIKAQAAFLVNDIEYMKSNNSSPHNCFYTQNMSHILTHLNNLETYDKNYYFSRRKNENITYIKNNIRNTFHNIDLANIKFTIRYNEICINKSQSCLCQNVFAIEVDNELNLIREACQKLIESIDDIAPLIFTKDQMADWIRDNIVVVNSGLNSKVSKI